MCGMSQSGQHATMKLIEYGADVEALDTYGMTPLHRMASNNLPIGAKELLESGADPLNRGKIRATPMEIALSSRAQAVIDVLREYPSRKKVNIASIVVSNAADEAVNGKYVMQSPS